MVIGKKIAMGVLAGVTALAMTMPQAEARNGRNAALLGGLFLGAVARAAPATAPRKRRCQRLSAQRLLPAALQLPLPVLPIL